MVSRRRFLIFVLAAIFALTVFSGCGELGISDSDAIKNILAGQSRESESRKSTDETSDLTKESEQQEISTEPQATTQTITSTENITETSAFWQTTEHTVTSTENIPETSAFWQTTEHTITTTENIPETSAFWQTTERPTNPPPTKPPVIEVTSVTLSESSIVIDRNQAFSLTVSVYPGNATDRTLTWHSSNPDVISISKGSMTALKSGTSVITVRSNNGIEAHCEITVMVPVSSVYIEFDRTYRTYKVGETAKFKVRVYPEDATDTSYSISVSGSGGELSGDNAILCKSGGSLTVTATASDGSWAKANIEIIDLNAYAKEVLRLTNIERQKEGLSQLFTNDALAKTAEVRAYETITLFSHTRPDGRDCFSAYDENGVEYMTAGENIAAGQSTPEEVVEGWMNSPGHRANILTAEFGHLGVGVVMDSNGRLYWSQNFTD